MGGIDPTDDWTALLGGFVLAGAGVGLLNPVIADVALCVVPKEQSGMASGINDTFRQVGIAVGIAAWGAIFLSRGAEEVEQLAAGTPGGTGERPRQLIEALVGEPRRGGGLRARRRPERWPTPRRGLHLGPERDHHARRWCSPSPGDSRRSACA